MKNIILSGPKKETLMLKCHICYGVAFTSWTDYHFHYQDEHREESKYSHNHAADIRTQAMAEPKRLSTRKKSEIVSYGESFMSEFILKGYDGKGLYD